MTPAAPAKNGQFQPVTSTSSKDCVGAVTAMLVERATGGRVRPTHADIRKRSGAPSTRGIADSEAVKAAATYGVKLTVLTGQNRDQVKNLVGNGRAVGVSISCAVTVHTKRATNAYTGPHKIFMNAYQWWPGGMKCECELGATYPHGEFLNEDPGTTLAGYLWWSADLVYRAAEARTGGHGINILVGPDTEGVAWLCIASATVRKEPSNSSPKHTSVVPGTHPHAGGRTQNGGTWPRANGTLADEWIHIQTPWVGGWGWVPGKTMRLAAA